MPTTTTTYSFNKPVVGADEDDWGGYLNGNWDSVDDLLDGTTPVTGIDINSGTLNGVTIGGTTAGAGTFTTLTANTSITGTLATAAQPNITSVGSLTSLDVAGAITSDGLTSETSNNIPLTLNGGANASLVQFTGGTADDFRFGTINSKGTLSVINSTDDRYVLDIQNNGDISFYEDTGTTAKFFWDASAESLGIGTTSPEGLVSLPATASNTPKFRLQSATTNTDFAISSYADANGTYVSLGANHYLDSGGSDAVFETTDRSAYVLLDARNNGAVVFGTNSSGIAAERMRIDSSGNVGIGTSSPSTTLHVYDAGAGGDGTIHIGGTSSTATGQLFYEVSGATYLRLRNTYRSTSANAYMEFDAGYHKFLTGTGGSEAMRIDSSGNVGIGTSSTSTNYGAYKTPLIVERSSGYGYVEIRSGTTANQAGLLLNRQDNTGWLYAMDNNGKLKIAPMASIDQTGLTNAKDGSTGITVDTSGRVGIGTTLPGDKLTVSGADAYMLIDRSNGEAGATFRYNADNTKRADIAVQTNGDLRIKTNLTERMRILAGGGITFNGDTAAANALDDYEEGTFTPSVSVGSVTSSEGFYTKIGRQVQIYMKLSQGFNTTNNEVQFFQGLPFTPAKTDIAIGSAMMKQADSANRFGTAYLSGSGVSLYSSSETGDFDAFRCIDLNSSAATIYIQGVYYV